VQGNGFGIRKILFMTTWKLNQPWTWLLRTVVLWTACTWGCWAADAPVPSTHFNQFIYVDEAQQLDIQTIQQASFVPLDGAPKLNFAHSVVWLKLEETQTIDDHRNWYMKFLPAMVTQATVYTASEFNPNEWDATTWTANELALPIPLSANPSQGAVYVRLLSPWNFRLNLMIDSKDKIDLVQRRIDMFVIMITTMTLLAFVLAVVRLMMNFNWLSLGIAALSLSIPTAWISAMGMLPFLTGIDQQFFHRLFPIAMMGGMTSFFFIWMVLATQLFKDGKWIKYLWIFAMVMGLIWLGGLLDAATAIQLMEPVYRYGQWVCIAVLIVQAIQARHQLKLGSEILLFVLLLLFMLMPYPSGSQLFKPFISPFGLGEISMVNLLMLIRTSVPLAILLLTAWTYDLLVSQRVTKINSQLTATRVALDKESARLKQQKQFIAMLTHELKNPLMASAMALSSIRQRLLGDESAMQRVNAINYSLDEIDGIIERCSEIDKFEQGYIPVNMEPFPLGTLLSVLKNTHPSERIYTIVRGCDEHQLINTDMHYVKAILKNLLTNAIKYAAPETLIEFNIESDMQGSSGRIVFTVTNEVPPDGAPNPEMVFQRYYRSELAKQQSGAGLGLWLAQSMAHALGTEIVYAQEHNNVRFHFAIKV
jgi:signal transduction histidine kinase